MLLYILIFFYTISVVFCFYYLVVDRMNSNFYGGVLTNGYLILFILTSLIPLVNSIIFLSLFAEYSTWLSSRSVITKNVERWFK